MKKINQYNQLFKLFREVLNEDYLSWDILSYNISGGDGPSTEIDLTLVQNTKQQKEVVLKGSGDGMIDAFFSAMLQVYATEFPSIKAINFTDFKVTTDIQSKHSFSGSDSEVQVEVTIENSYKKQFTFASADRSMIAASLISTLSAFEFFVNSEKAYIVTLQALNDSKERHRNDLTQSYQNVLVKLVQNTSYSEVIENLKKTP
ncbi:MAG: hypothetical protein ISR65_07570 [Bacteriovoracaceae bacterium]|nr:hypothetical protein [Bacteriovoracaceae bacterium]